MAATFVTSGTVAPGASATKGIFQLTAGTFVPVRLCAIDISMDGGASSYWPTFNVIIGSGSFTAATGGTTLTPAAYNGEGHIQTAAAVPKRGTFTAELAAGTGTLTTITNWYLPNSAGLFYQFPLGRELFLSTGQVFYLQIVTPASFANNIAVNIVFEE